MSGPLSSMNRCSHCGKLWEGKAQEFCDDCWHELDQALGGPDLRQRVGALEAWQREVMAEPFRRWKETGGLLTRIESLERWRKCKYGTYLATDEDVQEWSGRKGYDEPGIVLIEGEVLTNYLKVRAAGFHWRFCDTRGTPRYFAAIRVQLDRWTFADALANTLEAAILMCFSRAAEVFPGLHGTSYDRDTKVQMIVVPEEAED